MYEKIMDSKTKNSGNEQVKAIVVPIEQILPGIEGRYRKILDIASREGRWPLKKDALTNKKLEKIASESKVIIEPVNPIIEKRYRKMMLTHYQKGHPIRAFFKEIYYRLTKQI